MDKDKNKEEIDMASVQKELKGTKESRKALISQIAKEACDKNNQAMRRLSKN